MAFHTVLPAEPRPQLPAPAPTPTPVQPDSPTCCARAFLEGWLDRYGWPWNPSVSRWLDALVLAEEQLTTAPTALADFR